MSMAKISSKGQIALPKRIRKVLGVKPGDMVEIETKANVALIRALKKPSESIRGLGLPAKEKLRLQAVELLRELRREDEEKL